MKCPYCKDPQSPVTGHCATPGCGNNLDIANCSTPAQAREQGYAQAIAEVVALLKTSRTVGGEVITSARHAAVVIERGDARVAARLVQLEAAEKAAETTNNKAKMVTVRTTSNLPGIGETIWVPDTDGTRVRTTVTGHATTPTFTVADDAFEDDLFLADDIGITWYLEPA